MAHVHAHTAIQHPAVGLINDFRIWHHLLGRDLLIGGNGLCRFPSNGGVLITLGGESISLGNPPSINGSLILLSGEALPTSGCSTACTHSSRDFNVLPRPVVGVARESGLGGADRRASSKNFFSAESGSGRTASFISGIESSSGGCCDHAEGGTLC